MASTRRARTGTLTLALLAATGVVSAAEASRGARAWCGTTRNGARDAVWAHRERSQREGVRIAAAGRADLDVGEIAVLQDAGDLALLRNPMDLQGAALRFTATGDGYAAARLSLPLGDPGTTRLSLGDDDSQSVQLPFAFPFYGRSYGEFVYGTDLSASVEEAAAGIAPGAERNGLTALDLSAAAGESGAGALAEGYRADDELDVVAVARRFYASHRDDYRQLVIFTSRRLTPRDTFASERTVRNATRGIGDSIFDLTGAYGSAGRLESVAAMDHVAKYPDDPERVFLGEDSALGVLAHESGHRWLARARFRDGESPSGELLGRDEVHWSFFADTDGSHLEGNEIQDIGGGQFQTGAAGVRYGPLDQYLMGIRAPEEVPPIFFVRQPAGAGDTDPGRDPQVGVRFSGVRRDVTVQDVIAALGPRDPPAQPAGEPWRQAFVFVSVGGQPDPALLAKLERLRSAWEGYFRRSTEGRLAVDPRLD